jgi:formylglycine-generating enzyme required for sulfatase activity
LRRRPKLTSALGLALAATALLVAAVPNRIPFPRRRKPPPVTSAAVVETPAPRATAAPAPTPAPPVPAVLPEDDTIPTTMAEQRHILYLDLAAELDLTAEQVDVVREIVEASPLISQGNPAISHHAMTRAQCRTVRAGLEDGKAHPPCDRRNMVPLYDPGAGETAKDARVCIDQFEFPDIPCDYPVVFPTSREAALLCNAVGKRICDAHEWEGACAGALHTPEVEYAFGKPRPYATYLHNKSREIVWAYGQKKDQLRCATSAYKSAKCTGGGYTICGTHTWPAGSFPGCVSPFGVYDLHGNAAEHMNLPLDPSQLASRGGSGQTEMKGSWFIFAHEEPHEDDCRWRAKDWHPSTLMAEESHRNYHLGFRCCADVSASTRRPDPAGP